MESILQHLPHILPCNECQQHATQYLMDHPVPNLKGLYRDTTSHNGSRMAFCHTSRCSTSQRTADPRILSWRVYWALSWSHTSQGRFIIVLFKRLLLPSVKGGFGWIIGENGIAILKKWGFFLEILYYNAICIRIRSDTPQFWRKTYSQDSRNLLTQQQLTSSNKRLIPQ